MTQGQAVQVAAQARPEYGVAGDYRFTTAELCILEVVWGHMPKSDALPPPGPVVDRVAWIVTFMMDPWTIDFAVDDATGLILRFRRSRGAALAGVGESHVRS
jgi:hypothetical protein